MRNFGGFILASVVLFALANTYSGKYITAAKSLLGSSFEYATVAAAEDFHTRNQLVLEKIAELKELIKRHKDEIDKRLDT